MVPKNVTYYLNGLLSNILGGRVWGELQEEVFHRIQECCFWWENPVLLHTLGEVRILFEVLTLCLYYIYIHKISHYELLHTRHFCLRYCDKKMILRHRFLLTNQGKVFKRHTLIWVLFMYLDLFIFC